MTALAPPLATTRKRGGGEIDLQLGRLRDDSIPLPAIVDKHALVCIRGSTEQIVRLCELAATASDRRTLNIAAQGLALHASEIIELARRLGGEA